MDLYRADVLVRRTATTIPNPSSGWWRLLKGQGVLPLYRHRQAHPLEENDRAGIIFGRHEVSGARSVLTDDIIALAKIAPSFARASMTVKQTQCTVGDSLQVLDNRDPYWRDRAIRRVIAIDDGIVADMTEALWCSTGGHGYRKEAANNAQPRPAFGMNVMRN